MHGADIVESTLTMMDHILLCIRAQIAQAPGNRCVRPDVRRAHSPGGNRFGRNHTVSSMSEMCRDRCERHRRSPRGPPSQRYCSSRVRKAAEVVVLTRAHWALDEALGVKLDDLRQLCTDKAARFACEYLVRSVDARVEAEIGITVLAAGTRFHRLPLRVDRAAARRR
eukprot:1920045-Prymnesium_polylepis.1